MKVSNEIICRKTGLLHCSLNVCIFCHFFGINFICFFAKNADFKQNLPLISYVAFCILNGSDRFSDSDTGQMQAHHLC